MIKDQMFSQMNQAALARLAGRDPREISHNAGVRYREQEVVCCDHGYPQEKSGLVR